MGKGSATGQAAPSLVKSEFFTFSAFMILLLFIVGAGEAPDATPPDWWMDAVTPNDDGGQPGQDGNVSLVRTEVQLVQATSYTNEGSTTEKTFEVDDPYAVEMTVTLVWSDDYGSNDELGLTLSNDAGELGSEQGTAGSLTVKYNAPGDAKSGDGSLVGNYTVSVEAINCPGLIGPLPVDRDNGNSWTLTVTLVVEEPAK